MKERIRSELITISSNFQETLYSHTLVEKIGILPKLSLPYMGPYLVVVELHILVVVVYKQSGKYLLNL